MVRFLAMVTVAVLVSSCGPTAILYTDPTFQEAAPELVQAWRDLAPLQAATVVALPAGSGLDALLDSLQSAQPSGPVLIGMALSSAAIQTLTETRAQNHFVFLVPQTSGTELPTLSVRRAEAWALVAQAAASPEVAAASFPLDATAAEIAEFAAAWNQAGGGPLTTSVGTTLAATPPPAQVFAWGGGEVDALVAGLPSTTKIHGNPGLVRPLGSTGLTWTIRKQGLGEFLWRAAHAPVAGPQFLPLETVLARR